MILHKILTANRRISNIEPQNVEGWNRCAQSFFYKIDRTPYFDVQCWMFDVRRSSVSYLIRLAVFGPAAALNTDPPPAENLYNIGAGHNIDNKLSIRCR